MFFQKRWAEYFTVIITASFIPFEIYHLIKGFDVFKSVAVVGECGDFDLFDRAVEGASEKRVNEEGFRDGDFSRPFLGLGVRAPTERFIE